MSWPGTGPPPADAISLGERRFLINTSDRVMGLAHVGASRRGPLSWRLELTFFPGGRLPDLEPGHIQIFDPEQVAQGGLSVEAIEPSGAGTLLVDLRVADRELDRRLAIHGEPFILTLVGVELVDPFFSRCQVSFSGAEGEGRSKAAAAPELPPTPEDVSYLAKDYESFRALILEHMARSAPNWTERNPADLGVTLVEVLAYAGDYLSYYQDAVGTEAYLQTARRRVSVRRHTALLDYRLDEGANSRMWIHVEVDQAESGDGDSPLWLPQGCQFLTDVGGGSVIPYPSATYDDALRRGTEVFESLYGVALRPSLNRVSIYPWSTGDYDLPRGTTSATLEAKSLELGTGDVVLFEQVAGSRDGRRDEAEIGNRQVVRLVAPPRRTHDPLEPSRTLWEIRWHRDDALRFGLPVRRHDLGDQELAVARGNLVLADHGRTVFEQLSPVPPAMAYRPRLEKVGKDFRLVHHEPFLLSVQRQLPAARAAEQDRRATIAAVTLLEVDETCWVEEGTVIDPRAGRPWLPLPDLLRCSRFARRFAVETENDGTVQLLFGDDRNGLRPAPGMRFWAFYRIAKASDEPIGADTRGHLVVTVSDDDDGQPSMSPEVEVRVRSARFPTGAMGVRAPESNSHARIFAPQEVWREDRCVTAEDFEGRALAHPEVSGAACHLRWGGSWTLACLRVQRARGLEADAAFRAQVARSFEGRLVMGYQLEVLAPRWVPLDIALRVRVADTRQRRVVERGLRRVLGSGTTEDGADGLFRPGAFGFGADVAVDDVVDAALSVAGVVDVEVLRFRRLATTTGEELRRGLISIGDDEIAEISAEHGVLELRMEGGR